jgi:O-antigen ligase
MVNSSFQRDLAPNICIFLIPALSLVVNSGYSYGALFLILLSVFYLIKGSYKLSHLTNEDKLIIFAFLGYFLSFFLSYLVDGFHTRELDRPSRFILAILALIYLTTIDIKPKFFLFGVVIGSIGAGSLAIYQFLALEITRPNGFSNTIMFGNDAFLLGLLTLCFCKYQVKIKNRLFFIILLIALIFAFSAFILSETRGGWLAATLVFFILWQQSHKKSKLVLLRNVIFCISFFFLIILIISPEKLNRLQSTYIQIQALINGDYSINSTTLRIEIWKSAWITFKENLILGAGQYGSKEYIQQQITNGIIHPSVLEFDHSHNEILTALSYRGIVGFIALLFIYLVPIYLFLKRINSSDSKISTLALAGSIVSFSYVLFGLTQSMFEHNSGVTIYSFYIIILWASIRCIEKNDKTTT